ncbi:MAG TPA: GNAT family N-acetyltransferase [Fimbriimonadaceae bacterium]
MLSEPILLDKSHDCSHFDCGKEPLNTFLGSFALTNQKGGLSRTYIVLSEGKVAGYYSLAPAGVEPAHAPDRVMKGQPQHPVPCILLATLAVDRAAQGTGVGTFLFRDAMLRAFRAHEQIGGRAFLVHAMDEEAKTFYMKYGMLQSPTHQMHLFLLFKDIRNALER